MEKSKYFFVESNEYRQCLLCNDNDEGSRFTSNASIKTLDYHLEAIHNISRFTGKRERSPIVASQKGCDLIVNGSGPAGLACAIAASNRDWNVKIIEKKQLGGLCLNTVGPGKTLIDEAHKKEGNSGRVEISKGAAKFVNNYTIKSPQGFEKVDQI